MINLLLQNAIPEHALIAMKLDLSHQHSKYGILSYKISDDKHIPIEKPINNENRKKLLNPIER